MNTTKTPFTLIEKETITEFSFPKQEVLLDAELLALRAKNIEKGMSIGNLQKTKVEIFFEDSEGLKKVQTTIWGVTENYLILKGNLLIPIQRIHQVAI